MNMYQAARLPIPVMIGSARTKSQVATAGACLGCGWFLAEFQR
jgi:hypothetical protein